jgi:hypothetical protein
MAPSLAEDSTERRRPALSPGERARVVGAVAILVVLFVAVVAERALHLHLARPASPVATTAPSPQAAATWTYRDLNGLKVVVVAGPTGSRRFASQPHGPDIPLAIRNIDETVQQGDPCPALQSTYQTLREDTNPSASAHQRASAYARYALDQAKRANCPWAV